MKKVVEIAPVTRIEGHGRVRVHLTGRRVERVELCLVDSPRLFEALLLGKGFAEVPEIVCRICSLCSTVHRLCAILAVEKALGVEVPEEVRLHRELILHGGAIESHALHLFCLSLPDMVGVSGFPGLAAKAPEELKRGLRLKAAGNLIQETVGGRLIHPVTLIPGGMGKPVGKEGLSLLGETIERLIPDALSACELFAGFVVPTPSPPLPPPVHLAVANCLSSPLSGDRLVRGHGSSFPVAGYREEIRERVVPHSRAKVSTTGGETVTVGALSRLHLDGGLSPLAADALSRWRPLVIDADIRANHLAQAIELVHTLERSLFLIETLRERKPKRSIPPRIEPRPGEGSAALEAPRGLLIHSYAFDGRGICTAADVVTPTALNQAAMERDLTIIAKNLEGEEVEMAHALERHIRAYDPCISCAVHLVRR